MYHKFLNLAIAAIGFGALASCSSDDNLSKKEAAGGEGDHYLAINIKSVAASPSLKAVEGYENGSAREGQISQLRFYFFDEKGDAFNIASTGTNYYTVPGSTISTTEIQGGSSTTVERQTTAVVVVDGQNGGTPSQVIAVVNYNSFRAGNANGDASNESLFDNNRTISSIDALKNTALLSYAYNNGSGTDFAMSNSVYKQGEDEVCAVSMANNVRTSPEDAMLAPVDIYVERLAAKVTANKSDDPNWVTVDGKDAYRVDTLEYSDNGVTKTVYVDAVIQGWGLADEQKTGKVEKDISTDYDVWGGNLGFTTWNTADYHRCFWEATPAYARGDHAWSSYTHGFSDTDAQYTMPNTTTATFSLNEANRSSSPNELTKVLVAAKLYYTPADDAAATPKEAEICHDLATGTNYIGKENLRNAVLARVTGLNNGILKLTKDDGGNVTAINTLEKEDIDFQLIAGNTNRDYEVHAYLVQDANVTYAQQTGETKDVYTELPVETSNGVSDKGYAAANRIINTNKANIYTSGDTYYYTSIQHLAATAASDPVPANWYSGKKAIGWFGVVRNHWYKFTINSLNGLGTAVFDPDRVIIPVIPEQNQSYLAARINVLQWRVVPQTVDINGNAKTK